MRSILRYEVPVDDQWHEVKLFGEIVHVAARKPDVVEFWAEHNGEGSPWAAVRRFRVYSTGQPHVEGSHVGTTIAASGAPVWHLREQR